MSWGVDLFLHSERCEYQRFYKKAWGKSISDFQVRFQTYLRQAGIQKVGVRKGRDLGKHGHVYKGGQENRHPTSMPHHAGSPPVTSAPPWWCTWRFLSHFSQICVCINAFGNWREDGIRLRGGGLSHLSLYQNFKAFWKSILSYLIEMNGKHYIGEGVTKHTQPKSRTTNQTRTKRIYWISAWIQKKKTTEEEKHFILVC